MQSSEIKQILKKKILSSKVFVTNEGNHFNIVVISDIFENMTYVKQQQIIYAILLEYINDNRIHSVSIKTYSVKQWNSIIK